MLGSGDGGFVEMVGAFDDIGTFDLLEDKVGHDIKVGGLEDEEMFDGRIRDARFWSTARSTDQIRDGMHVLASDSTDLLARYLLDEGSGEEAFDATGITGSAAINGASWMACESEPDDDDDGDDDWDATACHSLEFDGSDDYVHLGEADNLLGVTNAFTMSAWVRGGDGDVSGTILDAEYAASGSPEKNAGYRFRAMGPPTKPAASFGTGDIPDNDFTSSVSWATSGWAHLVVPRDDTTMKFYVSGELIDTVDELREAIGVAVEGLARLAAVALGEHLRRWSVGRRPRRGPRNG